MSTKARNVLEVVAGVDGLITRTSGLTVDASEKAMEQWNAFKGDYEAAVAAQNGAILATAASGIIRKRKRN